MIAKIIMSEKVKGKIIPFLGKKVQLFYVRAVYPSRIRSYSYLLYPNLDYCLIKTGRLCGYLKQKLWVHTDVEKELLYQKDFIYGKILNIKYKPGSGIHISVLHIPDHEIRREPYIIITSRIINAKDLFDGPSNTWYLSILIKPSDKCPPEFFDAFKLSLFMNSETSDGIKYLFLED